MNNGTIAESYFRDRGVSIETAVANRVEFRPSEGDDRIKASDYRRRLGQDTWQGIGLQELIESSIWFPCLDPDGSVVTWICKPFPSLPGKNGDSPAKFLTQKGFYGYPFIPAETWKVSHSPNKPITFCEGPVKCLAAQQAGAHAIGVNGVWQTTDKNEQSGATALHPVLINAFTLSARAVYLAFDADFATNPSVRHALIRTTLLFLKAGAEVKILTWPIAEGKGLDDYLFSKGGDAAQVLKSLYDSACALAGILRPCDLDHVRSELILARLADSKLNQICKMVSRALDVRASTLEDECKPKATEGKSLAIEDPTPWSEPVNGAELLDELYSVVRAHVVLRDSEAATIAIWVMLTHCEPFVDVMPFLGITSPEPECGKSTLLKVMKRLTKKAIMAASITPAAVYRTIDLFRPTLLIDEADTFLKENDELRGVLNAGHERESYAVRTKPENDGVDFFPTWCPKAIALIGKLPETLAGRSLHIPLQKREKHEKITKLRDADPEVFKQLASKAFRWAQDNGETVKATRPPVSDDRLNRCGDNWFPILSIALVIDGGLVIGGGWYEKIINAASNATSAGNESVSQVLLALLKRIAEEDRKDFFPTKELLEKLNADDEAPWASWKNKMTAKELCKIMKGYRLKSDRCRHGGNAERGYQLKGGKDAKGVQQLGLQDVFDRYIPAPIP